MIQSSGFYIIILYMIIKSFHSNMVVLYVTVTLNMDQPQYQRIGESYPYICSCILQNPAIARHHSK